MAHAVITGNVGKDIQLKQSQQGKPWCTVSIGWSERVKDANGQWENGPTVWVSARVFGAQAEHVAQSISKGMKVVAAGDLRPETWSGQNGEETVITMMADSITPALFNQVAQVTKAQQQQQQQGGGWNQQPAQAPQTGNWSAPTGQQAMNNAQANVNTVMNEQPPF